jgi:peptidyl-prolyl cis-trans isomerase C
MKMHKLLIALSILAMTISVFGCSSSQDKTVLARVNRAKITAADFKDQLESLQPQMQMAVASDAKTRKDFLDDMIGIELVLQEARRQGLDKDADFKKRQEARKQEMERSLREEAKNDLFNTLLKKELSDKLKAIPEPTEKEVGDYFIKNKSMITAAVGRQVSLEEIAPRLKQRILAERQRELYLTYAKELKAKSKITVDEKALDDVSASIAKSMQPSGLELQTPEAHPKNQHK